MSTHYDIKIALFSAWFLLFAAFIPAPVSSAPSTGEALFPLLQGTTAASCNGSSLDFRLILQNILPSTDTYLAQLTLIGNAAGKQYIAYLYDGFGGTTTLAVATSTAGNGAEYEFNFPQHTRASTTYEIFIDNLGYSTTWTTSAGNSNFYVKTSFNSCGAGATLQASLRAATTSPTTPGSNTTTTIPMYTSTNGAKIESMNCIYTSTTSLCTPIYASTTSPVTPENIFYIFAIFALVFVCSYFLVAKMTT